MSNYYAHCFNRIDFVVILSYVKLLGNLKIPDYNNCDPLEKNLQEPVLKGIAKCRNHPNTLTTGDVCKKTPNFLLGVLIKMKF